MVFVITAPFGCQKSTYNSVVSYSSRALSIDHRPLTFVG
jgi:hypothetical protein